MRTTTITIEELLQTTSRTFALSIPLLPAPLDHQITLAYLVFRIADTMEDADHLNRNDRQSALRNFCSTLSTLLSDGDPAATELWTDRWCSSPVSHNEDYNRLLRETPRVLALVYELDERPRKIIVQHAIKSASGMAEFLDLADDLGHLQLQTIQQLRQYCYYVAGVVGEMITELFIANRTGETDASGLNETAACFGEGLQLVNILKDSADDHDSGRAYLPVGVSKDQVFQLARTDLEQAKQYVATLRELSAPAGFLAFCDAPLRLAEATLDVVERDGPGSKVPKAQVFALLEKVMDQAGLKN